LTGFAAGRGHRSQVIHLGTRHADDHRPPRDGSVGVQRRKLLAVAGALSVTAFATTVGLGANFGLFGITEPDSPAGRLDPSRAGTSARPVTPASVSTAAPALPARRQPDD